MSLHGGDHRATRIDRPNRLNGLNGLNRWEGWMNGRINRNRLRIGAPVLWTGHVWFADRINAALDDSARFIPLFNTNINSNSKKRLQNSHRDGRATWAQINATTNLICIVKIYCKFRTMLNLCCIENTTFWQVTVDELMRGRGLDAEVIYIFLCR